MKWLRKQKKGDFNVLLPNLHPRVLFQVLNNVNFLGMHKGSIPLVHPSLHSFRDCDPSKFIGEKTMMNFHYLSAAQRAEKKETETKSLFLSASERSPIKKEHSFRPNQQTQVIQPKFQ